VRVSPGVGRPAVTGNDQAVARRYARAVLDVARGQGGEVSETTRTELDALARLVDTDDVVRGALVSRALTPEARRRAAAAVAQAAKLSPLTARTVEMLAAHDRLALLPALAEAYTAAWNAAQGIVTAEAVSAAPLEPFQLEALTSALRDALGAKVHLRSRVEPAVLGGVLVNAMGRTYDGTVRGRLAALRRRLTASQPR
jgi:F-type H+-transporting ATPase subunit delta